MSIIDNIKTALVRVLIKDAEKIRFTGIVRVRELPRDCTLDYFNAWWPRLTERERDRYTTYEVHNVLTSNGRNALLTYASNGLATTWGFAQWFSVGTTAIISVSAGDTSIQGELFRAAPSATTITGNQVNVSTYFGPAQANGSYTNAGLFGGTSATATLGTGTLHTHTLYTYTKSNGIPITNDYVLQLQ